MFRKILSVVLLGVSCGALAQGKKVEGPITYKEIGDQYISSFDAVQGPEKVSLEELENPTLKPVEIDELFRKKLAFEILANNECATVARNVNHDSVRVLLRELGVFRWQGEDATQHLVSKLNRTQTVFGEAVLTKMLATPLTDADQLRKRQAFIKKLATHDQLCAEAEALMAKVKTVEPELLSFWLEENPVTEKNFRQLYFGSKMAVVGNLLCRDINQSSAALELWVRLGNLNTAWQATSDFIMTMLCTYGLQKIAERMTAGQDVSVWASWRDAANVYLDFVNPKAYWDAYKRINSAEFENEMRIAYEGMNPRIRQFYGVSSEQGYLAQAKRNTHIILGIKGALGAVLTACKAHQIKTIAGHVGKERDSLNYLQTNVIGVATVVDCAKQIHERFIPNKVVTQGLKHGDAISTVFTCPEKVSVGFAELIGLLQTNTFKGKASIFSLSGRVLAAHKLMKEHKAEFADLLQALGEIDACLSVAKVVKEFERERVTYSFVEYADSDAPYINLQNFWNPFINPQAVVPNSVELGVEDRHVLVTGSNTGGKSTVLKGIMLSQLLGQTLGIAPAEKAIVVPAQTLLTAFNLSDDTVAGSSSFQAEITRAHELVKTAASLKPGERGIFVIDELFKGTSADKGESAAREIIERLSQFDNVIFMYATHYHGLTDLDCCQNYKVDAYQDADGAIVRPFKLEKGVSTNNIADQLVGSAIPTLA